MEGDSAAGQPHSLHVEHRVKPVTHQRSEPLGGQLGFFDGFGEQYLRVFREFLARDTSGFRHQPAGCRRTLGYPVEHGLTSLAQMPVCIRPEPAWRDVLTIVEG
ncbi:hypothetical protein ABIF68_011090 [Bradyrhizobium japonicum]|jgi:hypothetical protein